VEVEAVKRLVRRLFRIPASAAPGDAGRISSSASSDGVPLRLGEAMYVPSGHDPYGPHFADEDCVLSMRTGHCIRAHECPEI
jgi:hypothetical protein